jgi:putative Mg2+ transporter-C (MgtC) family protein
MTLDLDTLGETVTPVLEILLRLGLAAALGMLIGIDREVRRRPARLRTHMLVSLAAAVFTIITFELFYKVQALTGVVRADPIRVIEAVTAGVAFLAAGTIIHARGKIQGLTTGASMWLAGATGLACGGGFYVIAGLTVALVIPILVVLHKLEVMAERRSGSKTG